MAASVTSSFPPRDASCDPSDRTLSGSPMPEPAERDRTMDEEKGTGDGAREGLKAISDVPPDGGYGWVVVGCVCTINAMTWGINTTFGVFFSFLLEQNYYEGGTPLRYAFVGGLSVGMALAVAPLANAVVRKWGFRWPLVFGVVATTLGQCLASVGTSYTSYIATQGLLFGIGLGFVFVPSAPLLAHWFRRRLGVAQGIAGAGSGVGGLIWSNTTRAAIESIGFKWTLVMNGCITGAILLPAVLLLKGRGQTIKATSNPFQYQFLWHPGFTWAWLFGFCAMMAYFTALYSLASFATSALGLSQTQGAALQSILSAGQMIGRPACGLVLDRVGRINATIVVQLLAGVTCLAIWLPSRSFGVLVLFALTQGIFGGAIWSTVTPVLDSVVGTRELGSALAVFWVLMAPASFVGQPIAIALINYSRNTLGREGARTYEISIGFCGGMFLLAGCMLLGAKRHVQQGSLKLLQKA